MSANKITKATLIFILVSCSQSETRMLDPDSLKLTDLGWAAAHVEQYKLGLSLPKKKKDPGLIGTYLFYLKL